ncbi:hypothetical protein SCUP234_02857 [Seiridium cupressi]
MVVNTEISTTQGRKRSQVFTFAPASNLSDIWDSRIPREAVDSLWLWAQCTVFDSPRAYDTPDYIDGSDVHSQGLKQDLAAFDHWYGRIFGLGTSQPRYNTDFHAVTPLSFVEDGLGNVTSTAELSQGYMAHADARIFASQKLSCGANKLSSEGIQYSDFDCDTLRPGQGRYLYSGLDFTEARNIEFEPQKIYSSSRDSELKLAIRPRWWLANSHLLHSAVARSIWIQAYYPSFVALVSLLVGVVFSSLNGVPLLVVSTLLHWLVSNCLFILIVEGHVESPSIAGE